MQVRRGFKYQLKVNTEELEHSLNVFSGHRRFAYNYFLRKNLDRLNSKQPIMWYPEMEWFLSKILMQSVEHCWLKDAPKAILQQCLRDLSRAFSEAFDPEQPNKRLPVFKKKRNSQTFRYPQILQTMPSGEIKKNLKIDNRRIWLPKIGWVGFYKSQALKGDIKNVTVTSKVGQWFVSIQTEWDIDDPVHPSKTYVGCDRGVSIPFATSDGKKSRPLKALKQKESKLAELQVKAANQVKFSSNWKKTQNKIRQLHYKVGCSRKDYIHKLTTKTSNNHAMVYLESLIVGNMTKRPKPKAADDGVHYDKNGASSKSGLNKAILDVGWGMYESFLRYKQVQKGGFVASVPAPGTSQTCPCCSYRSSDNRQTQARFHCVACGFQANADWVASVNIETRGQAGDFASSKKGSQKAGPELIEFGRGLVCGSKILMNQRMQKTVGSRETHPPH